MPLPIDAQPKASVDRESYARAERFLPWNKGTLGFNTDIQATWITGTEILWYKSSSEQGWTFILADPRTGRKAPAFDHERMAQAIGKTTGATVVASRLPITALEFPKGVAGPQRVTAIGKVFDCHLPNTTCSEVASAGRAPDRAYSPDGRYAVFTKGYDLWLEDRATGTERPLSTDGERLRAYGATPDMVGWNVTIKRLGWKLPPSGEFSPDGSKFVTYRANETRVPELTLLQHLPEDGSTRPKPWTYRMPWPGDPPAVVELFVFDLASGARTKVNAPGLAMHGRGPIFLEQVGWHPEGRSLHLIDYTNSYRELGLFRSELESGRTVRLIGEKSDTNLFTFFAPKRVMLSSGDIIWPSEQSGWRHLYYHDRDGALRHPITSGPWVVREILRVDEAGRTIVFSASGRERDQDAYYRQVYEVGFDGKNLRRLTNENADHEVRFTSRPYLGLVVKDQPSGFSSSGRYFIDAYSRPDLPTVTVVRERSGRVVLTLETARVAADLAKAWLMPEPFKATAADDSTVIYGTIFKPANFDPERRYPVIDVIYGGPQAAFVWKRFLDEATTYYGRSLAELGFIVVAIDGRGTPLRSRAFQLASYGKLGTAGFLEDHVAAIREIARTRPYMDVTKVGIYGYSAGGFAVVHALFDYPDFFKVGVAASSYDPLTNVRNWSEWFQGPYDPQSYAAQSSYRNAANFKGKLFLATGDMDDNVHPANTMRVVDELIKHNKTFDLLVIPNGNHGAAEMPYLIRRQWDFFVTNLLGASPPPDYLIAGPGQP